VIAGSCGFPLLAQEKSSAVRPFRVAIPQKTIHRILRRVRETRFPERLDTNDWSYGANWDYMKELAAYWSSRYDWRKTEARINSTVCGAIRNVVTPRYAVPLVRHCPGGEKNNASRWPL